MTEIGSEQAFDDIVQKTDKLVVVDFATTWCGPCKVMEPKMNQISEEYTDAEFYKVVGDASADASKLMKREGVRTVPSFHFWKGNSRVEVINGANIEAVTKAVQKHKTRRPGARAANTMINRARSGDLITKHKELLTRRPARPRQQQQARQPRPRRRRAFFSPP